MGRFKVEFDEKKLKANVLNYPNKINNGISAVIDYNAAYTTGWLKQNAPWHDNTGAARSGLVALPFNDKSRHEILMAYSVYYGIWLEVAHSGRWAIITPAMRIIGEKVMRDLQLFLSTMR